MNSTAPVKSANTETALQSLATLYKAGGDPLRLDILRVLQRDTFGVMELCQLFNMRQSGMSHHLKVLTQAGLLEPQREGNATFYRRPLLRIGDEPRYTAVKAVFDAVDQIALSDAVLDRIRNIRRQRSEQSQVFFARYARRFREQQELIAGHERYAQPVAELIRRRFPCDGTGKALEIGPGEGPFLPMLSGCFEELVAVDNVRAMLDRAEQYCEQKGLGNVRLVHGECPDVIEQHETFNLVVANMVLHHVASPANIFRDSAQLLESGGRMIISELCRHEQSWVRDNCGDIWQGFEPEELTGWATDAGLKQGETLFIGLRNGFQIQVREFTA
ncbi:ArsR family transcriptional regulator [Halospina denitrificans]|uniref:ArsR family transcriptional regulator n=1 Tax=Halospina denitrificans TaxID=332522 RepID=A0A4R7JZ59_9GAMM|nr:metalloregulator ArsR/SmtB family transcription factor [Halospina denitrificans]TDT43396.1 ArsR family transcriptional regulator [Halospina denitrificans]